MAPNCGIMIVWFKFKPWQAPTAASLLPTFGVYDIKCRQMIVTTRSSATAEIAHDADDVDFKHSKSSAVVPIDAA